MEGSMGVDKNNFNAVPKLRKNRKIESRWGQKYYNALKNAIFTPQSSAYVPPELPPSMSKEITQPEPLYICKQCNDCFRFKSSYEEHISRHSWVLGYWCQQCFVTVCTHNSPSGGLPCTVCLRLDRNKRSYLRSKGLHKTQKLGAIKVFYNQCQFFAHLKSHVISSVDMADLMLMPTPTNMIGNYWSTEFDIACEALMEQAFILKKHALDLLKVHEAESNWWLTDTDNEISRMIRNYKGRSLFHASTEEGYLSPRISQSATVMRGFSTEKEDNKSIKSPRKMTNLSSSKVKHEYEDNPCIPNDITFVDCGPARKGLAPELPMCNPIRKHATILVKSNPDSSPKMQTLNLLQSKRKKVNRILSKCASPDMPISYGNTTITPRVSLSESSTDKPSSNATSDGVTMKLETDTQDSSKEVTHHPTSDSAKPLQTQPPQVVKRKTVQSLPVNSKLLTVQHSKNVDLTAIINHISPQLGTNKRIVFIGQDNDRSVVNQKQDLSKKIIQVLPEVSISKTLRNIKPKIVSSTKTENLTDDDKDARNVSNNSSTPKPQNGPVTKVIYQNGRKYIIKPASGPIKCGIKPNSIISDPKNVLVKPTTSEKNKSLSSAKSKQSESATAQENTSPRREDISPLTPSPSPSELSSSSSCDTQTKQNLPVSKNEPQICTPRLTDTTSLEQYENLSFCMGKDEKLYLNVTPIKRNSNHPQSDTHAMIAKCKQEMLNEFFHLPYLELKKRVEHLHELNAEITSLLKCVAENVVREKLKPVHILQHVLKHCMDKYIEKPKEVLVDSTLDDWEEAYENNKEKLLCSICKKALKPECYIAGFSKPAKDEETYCSCYKQFCHICDMYQGNSTRFVAHHNYHSKTNPYLCPDCYQRFRTFKQLEVHTWSVCFHTLKKRVFRCKICEIDGFGDIESITRHFAIMHSNTKIVCNVCNIVLPSLSDYKRHMRLSHRAETCIQPIRVVLCKLGQCIVRCENFMLHMEKHVVEQKLVLWFKCPFCSFVDLEAKQLMPHLQMKHLHRLSEIISPDALREIMPKELINAALEGNQQDSSEPPTTEFINEEPSEDGTFLPKIINARTITSEVFERGAQELDDSGSELANTKSAEMIPKIVNISSGNRIVYLNESNMTDTLPKILDVRSIADARSKDPESTTNSTATPNKESAETRNVYAGRKTRAEKILEEHDNCMKDTLAKPGSKSDGTVSVEGNSIRSCVMVKVTTAPEKPSAMDFLQKTEGLNDAKSKDAIDTEVAQRIIMSKPPPLTKIPEYALQPNIPIKCGVLQTKLVREKTQSQIPRNHKTARKSLQRIALNGPNAPSEKDLNFACHLCGDLISTSWPLLSAHYKESHSQDHELFVVSPTLERIAPDFINGGYKEVINDKKRKTEMVTVPSKRRRRWSSKKYIIEGRNTTDSPNLGLCVQQQTPEDGEGNIVCKKCNLRCTDMANLRQHIADAHRIKGRYLICLECGDNFVVAPSLQMHLKAIHGIDDPITYMSRNTLYAPDNIDDSDEESKTTEGNQCHVCMAVFENKAAVDKHLRVHGMAFLNRRMNEARNAHKTPEKIQKTEDEKSTPLKEAPEETLKRDKPVMSILDRISATI